MSEAQAVDFVIVRNTRAGSIHLMPHGAFELTSGLNSIESARFEALSPHVHDSIEDMVKEGWLKFGPEPEPDAEIEIVEVKLPEGFQPLPGDDSLALAAIRVQTDSAVLDAWFKLEEHRAPVSDALLARLQELEAK